MKFPLRVEDCLPKLVTTHVPMFKMLAHNAFVALLVIGIFVGGIAADRWLFRAEAEVAKSGELAATRAAFKSCDKLLDDWVRDQQTKKWRAVMQARDKAFHNPAVKD